MDGERGGAKKNKMSTLLCDKKQQPTLSFVEGLVGTSQSRQRSGEVSLDNYEAQHVGEVVSFDKYRVQHVIMRAVLHAVCDHA